ncbi:transcription elongation factor like protein [Zymoseptoria brevis]|uniref:Transcription elongation factor 1 homolog n=1 Tax=Zymoseptoria brevis TaxID=1047168 RepID=A0A0F4GYV6_9PEZI|nr:transcription elongation factor like protein [Zymoseptoria brevis]
MGKRKSSSKPQGPKKREALAVAFKCVFCNNESSVTVKIDKKQGVGNLSCKACNQNFQTSVNYLSVPVDVYSDWIDACDAVAKETSDTRGPAPPSSSMRQPQPHPSARAGLAPGEKYTAEDEGFIDDDDADPEADFADD